MPELQSYRELPESYRTKQGKKAAQSGAQEAVLGSWMDIAQPGSASAGMLKRAVGVWAGFSFILFFVMFCLVGRSSGCLAMFLFMVIVFGGAIGGALLFARAWQMSISRVLERPVADVPSVWLRRGDSFDLHYRQAIKNTVEIQGVSIQFILRETVSYTRGTDRYTERYDHVIQQFEQPGGLMRKGDVIEERITFAVPDDAMHTFMARNNRLQWFIVVRMGLNVWPHEYHNTYEITVTAQPAQEGSSHDGD